MKNLKELILLEINRVLANGGVGIESSTIDSWITRVVSDYIKIVEAYDEPKGNVFLDAREPDWNDGYLKGRADMKKELIAIMRGETK